MDSNPLLSQWKEGDSSGSEASRHEDDTSIATENKSCNTVQFIVGGEV